MKTCRQFGICHRAQSAIISSVFGCSLCRVLSAFCVLCSSLLCPLSAARCWPPRSFVVRLRSLFSGVTTTAANGRVASCRLTQLPKAQRERKGEKRREHTQREKSKRKASVKYACANANGNAKASPLTRLTLKTEETLSLPPSQSPSPSASQSVFESPRVRCGCRCRWRCV